MLDFPSRRTEHRRIGGVPVALASEADLVAMMVEDVARYRAGLIHRPVAVFDCNGQAMSMYATDPDYAAALDAADLIHADGQFIVWASHLFRGEPIPERTATTDFFHAAAAGAVRHGLSFFLLGGSEALSTRCAEEVARRYPELRIAGRRNGFFSQAEEADVVADINASGADILWVGMGKPREQAFVHRNRARLRCAWAVTCGGCFNYITGDYARAPLWVQKAGLEWLHRAMTRPRHLLWRYLVTTPHALALVVRDRLRSQGAAGAEHSGSRNG